MRYLLALLGLLPVLVVIVLGMLDGQAAQHVGIAVLALIGFAVYFLPTLVGVRKRNLPAIFVLNLLLGWTLIGWVAALVWATTSDQPQPTLMAI
jgi:hypothetical protein